MVMIRKLHLPSTAKGFARHVRVPDTLSTGSLVAGEILRRGHRWMRNGPLLAMGVWGRISSTVPDEWLVSPQDLRPPDSTLADDFYAGRYWFNNLGRETGGESPFAVTPPSANWQQELHGFRWLRHLVAADTELARAHGGALLQDWVGICGTPGKSAIWNPETLSMRLIAWSAHAPGLLRQADKETNRIIRRSLGRQARYLQNELSTMPVNEVRLHASIALVHSCICLTRNLKAIKQSVRDLDKEISRQTLADGGHISRNPSVLIDLLVDLIPLRDAFKSIGVNLSSASLNAIDRMSAALRFFRHSNGELATFNGTGETSIELLNTVLASSEFSDGFENKIQQSAPLTGYERMAGGNTVVLMDTGTPTSRPASTRALAGPLSFELSSGKNIFIMNCGMPGMGFETYIPFARSTAAHSTAVIADTSSSRYALDTGMRDFLPSALLSAPQTVTSSRRDEGDFFEVNASHDGYAEQFRVVHRRVVQLSKDGKTLNGADRFEVVGKPQNATVEQPVALRFHMPPSISASLLSSGHSILLAATDREAWTFTCVDAPIALEESIRFSGFGGPRKTEQIVVHANTARNPEIRWVLERRDKKQSPRQRKKADGEPNLLSGLESSG